MQIFLRGKKTKEADKKTAEVIKDTIALDRFFSSYNHFGRRVLLCFDNSLPSLTQIWVRATEVKSSRQLEELADQCDHAKRSGLMIHHFETKERQDLTRNNNEKVGRAAT